MDSLAKSQRLCLAYVLKKHPSVTNGLVSGFFFAHQFMTLLVKVDTKA